jgi:DNA-binding transcriptional ArsR family regulator
MSRENPKCAIFEQLATVARPPGSAWRLEILELLAQTERSVGELAAVGSLTIANASQHLQQPYYQLSHENGGRAAQARLQNFPAQEVYPERKATGLPIEDSIVV